MVMKKKFAFIILFVSVLCLLGWSYTFQGLKSEKEAKMNKGPIQAGQDISMYITTDVHYLSNKLTDNGKAFEDYVNLGDGKQLNDTEEITNAFSNEVEKMKPDVLIVSGDLTNNGEKESHIDLAKKFKRIEEKGTSVYVIPGNHDISNPWARSFKGDNQYTTDIIDEKEFRNIYADFGYDEAISNDEKTLSYLAAPSQDVWLLMLDTSQYKNNYMIGFPQTDGKLSPDTLEWIKECSDLADVKGAKIVTVMHHNIVDHSKMIRKGFTLNNNDEVLNLFQERHLNLVLSGHIHTQDISSYDNGGDILYDIVTGSLAVNPHQYGVLTYSAKDQAIDYHTAKVDVEKWAKEKGIKDKHLNDFEKYSEEYFGKFAYNMAYKRLMEETNYSETDIKSMSEVMKILNVRYFAGTESKNSQDVLKSSGYQLWAEAPDSFQKQYIMSMSSDYDMDDNQLHIKYGH